METSEISYDYDEATSCNRGWLTSLEQGYLQRITVSIAGLGGVGYLHALTLARLGVQNFRIADMDTFEVKNIQRQFGADMYSIGLSKQAVLLSEIQAINPKAQVYIIGEIGERNISSFVEGSRFVIDGLDFFALETRRLLFKTAQDFGLPALTAAPIATGASCMCFWPSERGMSFENYFHFGNDPEDNLVRFLVGMSPAFLHKNHLVDPHTVDFKNRKVPSTVMGCEVASAFVGSRVLEIVRGWVNRKQTVRCAPYCTQFDTQSGVAKTTRRGPRNPLRWLALRAVRKHLNRKVLLQEFAAQAIRQTLMED